MNAVADKVDGKNTSFIALEYTSIVCIFWGFCVRPDVVQHDVDRLFLGGLRIKHTSCLLISSECNISICCNIQWVILCVCILCGVNSPFAPLFVYFLFSHISDRNKLHFVVLNSTTSIKFRIGPPDKFNQQLLVFLSNDHSRNGIVSQTD